MGKEAFESILAGLEDALAYAQGDPSRGIAHEVGPRPVDVRAVRVRLGVTQANFARLFRVSVATVRSWEQGRRRPEGPARALLTVIEREPEAVKRALAGA